MGRMDHVVARLEREGDRGGVNAACTAALGHPRAEVRHREDRQVRRGHHDTRRHRRVKEGDHLPPEGVHRVLIVERSPIQGRTVRTFPHKERLFERDVLIGKGQFKMLAGSAVGYGEGNRHPIVQKLAHATQELGVRTGDGRLAHVKLRRRRGARALDRREGQALLTPEVELLR